MTTKIYKIQLPLLSNTVCPPAMVYSKGKHDIMHMDVTSDIKKLANGRNKFFIYGKLTRKNQLIIQKEAPDQEW